VDLNFQWLFIFPFATSPNMSNRSDVQPIPPARWIMMSAVGGPEIVEAVKDSAPKAGVKIVRQMLGRELS